MRPNVDLGETYTQSSSSDGDEGLFYSPEASAGHAEAGVNYSGVDASRRIVNPFESTSTNRAAAVATNKRQPTARKSTGRAGTNRRFSATPKRKAPTRSPTRFIAAANNRELKLLREILRLQNSTDFMVPRLPFARLVRELIRNCSGVVDRISTDALWALQESTELYITQQMQDAYMLTLHRGRLTLSVKDMELLRRLCRA